MKAHWKEKERQVLEGFTFPPQSLSFAHGILTQGSEGKKRLVRLKVRHRAKLQPRGLAMGVK